MVCEDLTRSARALQHRPSSAGRRERQGPMRAFALRLAGLGHQGLARFLSPRSLLDAGADGAADVLLTHPAPVFGSADLWRDVTLWGGRPGEAVRSAARRGLRVERRGVTGLLRQRPRPYKSIGQRSPTPLRISLPFPFFGPRLSVPHSRRRPQPRHPRTRTYRMCKAEW